MPVLPNELITEILYILPAKSLGRFKCVSKPWPSLISNPHFVKTHLSKISQNYDLDQKLIILQHLTDLNLANYNIRGALYVVRFERDRFGFELYGKKLSFQDRNEWQNVFGSCNGMIVVPDYYDDLCVLNPTTLESKKVKLSPLLCPTWKWKTMCGFGFDASSDDYKIVTVSYAGMCPFDEDGCKDMFVDVYTLKTNIWRRVKNSPYDHSGTRCASGAFMNGFIQWLAWRVSDGSCAIVAFDLSSEEFVDLVLPSVITNQWSIATKELAVLGGCLCLMLHTWEYRHETDVWMMKEYGVEKSWTKFSIVDKGHARSGPSCIFGGKEALLLTSRNCMHGDYLEVCNFEDQTLVDVEPIEMPDLFQVGLTFVESLVSPNNNNERDSQIASSSER